jgi:hypothetical protein
MRQSADSPGYDAYIDTSRRSFEQQFHGLEQEEIELTEISNNYLCCLPFLL